MSLKIVCIKEEPDCEIVDLASCKEEAEGVEQEPQDLAGSREVADDEFGYEVMLEPECVLLPVEMSHDDASPSLRSRDFATKAAREETEHNMLTDPLQDTVEISIGTYVCGNCGTMFQHERYLNRHMKLCRESRLLTKKSNANNSKTENKDVYFCDICQKDIPKLSNFRIHQRIHSKDRPFSCEVCKKDFKQAATLKVHMRTHTGEKPYSCQECDKQFSQLSTLHKHKFQHTGEKPFSCEVCQRQFTYLINLKTHRRTHTGEKPHACDMCRKKYATARELRVHKLVHTGERPHVCLVCKMAFRHLSTLKKHIEIHTPTKYPCEICNKEFALMSYLRRHKLNTHMAT